MLVFRAIGGRGFGVGQSGSVCGYRNSQVLNVRATSKLDRAKERARRLAGFVDWDRIEASGDLDSLDRLHGTISSFKPRLALGLSFPAMPSAKE